LLSTPTLKTDGQVLAIAAAVTTGATGAASAAATTTAVSAATTTAVSAATTTTVSAATTTVSATAATGGTFFTRARDVHGEAATSVIFAVHTGNRCVRLFRRRHRHEREAARATGNAIGDQGNVSDGAMGRKGLFEFIISGRER
jgi:ABC-type transporter Mla subunit MlaD